MHKLRSFSSQDFGFINPGDGYYTLIRASDGIMD